MTEPGNSPHLCVLPVLREGLGGSHFVLYKELCLQQGLQSCDVGLDMDQGLRGRHVGLSMKLDFEQGLGQVLNPG